MNIFLGDEVTLTKGTCWVTGKVNGIKLDKGHLDMVCIEELETWFSMGAGWRFISDSESEELDD